MQILYKKSLKCCHLIHDNPNIISNIYTYISYQVSTQITDCFPPTSPLVPSTISLSEGFSKLSPSILIACVTLSVDCICIGSGCYFFFFLLRGGFLYMEVLFYFYSLNFDGISQFFALELRRCQVGGRWFGDLEPVIILDPVIVLPRIFDPFVLGGLLPILEIFILDPPMKLF